MTKRVVAAYLVLILALSAVAGILIASLDDPEPNIPSAAKTGDR